MPLHASVDARVEALLGQMTLDEKIDYIGGHNEFYIRAIPRLGILELKMADGPLGVRNFGPAVSYPAGICLASTWNVELAKSFGRSLGQDARARGVHFLLAPGVNIYRAPMCGRNFEYLGEDPCLTSQMAVSIIKGIQGEGVSATVKHFAANNQEWNRHHTSSDVDERTLHEIYLPAFEAAVKDAEVGAIMNSYNLINGQHATEHGYLNNEVAKSLWGFDGIIMSDWTSTYDAVGAANGGLDLEMPYAKHMNHQNLMKAYEKGEVTLETIDDKVRRILRTAIRFGFFDRPQQDTELSLFNQDGQKTARTVAEEGIVLLKNEGLLPLDKGKIRRLAVIGPCARGPIPQGGGSSRVEPIISQSFLGEIAKACGSDVMILYSPGVPEYSCNFNSLSTTQDGSQMGLLGEYFDNPLLDGRPILVRIDEQVNFQWKERSFMMNGPVNHYSIRWTGYFKAPSTGKYTFYVEGHDGHRLFLDDQAVMDQWTGDTEALEWVAVQLEATKIYKIKLEYRVDKGSQGIKLGWNFGEDQTLAHTAQVAMQADAVLLITGFGDQYEGEDWDRAFRLPQGQNRLIHKVLDANPNTVVVTCAGGGIDMASWIDKTRALIFAWYPGQEGGSAISSIIFGDVSPSGKLPISIERTREESATFASYYDIDNSKRVSYTEGLFVGYRHFDKSDKKPLFAFGHGLSYSHFAYSNLKIERDGDETKVSFDLTNTGTMKAKEIAELYVHERNSRVVRPKKELKGFVKVDLAPNETRRCTLTLDARAFSYYDDGLHAWSVNPGIFDILVGSASDNIKLKGIVELR